MSVIITGASDDLIEIDGDIYEEFPALNTEGESPCDSHASVGGLLAFSDGTVLSITLVDEVWRIHQERRGPHSGDLTITQAVAGDPDNYTDRAEITGPITWVILGIDIATAPPAKATGAGTETGPELHESLGAGIALHAHATGVVTRPDGTVRR
jgi:hypothetical protein